MKFSPVLTIAGLSAIFLGGCASMERQRAEEDRFRDQMRTSMALVLDPVIDQARAKSDAKLKPLDQMFDPKVRDEVAVEAIPAMHKLTTLLGQKADLINDKDTRIQQINLMGLSVMMGDEDADKALIQMGQDTTQPDMATRAKLSRLTGMLWRAYSEPAEQEKVVEELKKLAQSDPKNDLIFLALRDMTGFGAANESIRQQIKTIMFVDCIGRDAMAWRARPDKGKVISFKAMTPEGTPIDIEQYRGKVVVLSFWATWCPWCREELPELGKLYEQEKDNGLVVIGVLTEDTLENLAKFRAKNPYLTWPIVQYDRELLETEYGVANLPSKLIIGPDGRVVLTTGGILPDDLAKVVRQILPATTQPMGK